MSSGRCNCLLRSAESTTITLLAELAGLLQPLREFTKTKPIWGTCAGAILLAQTVENPKKGGQELLNGMTLTVARNGWGSQVRQAISVCDTS
jgi:5'-phosphate synthase pdxT subunit